MTDEDYKERKLLLFLPVFFLYVLAGPLILSSFLCKFLTVGLIRQDVHT